MAASTEFSFEMSRTASARPAPTPARRPKLRPVPSYARPLTVDRCLEVDLQVIADHRGDLVVAELGRHLPFPVRRMYSLVRVPGGAERGGHAHLELEQLMFVLSGGLDLVLDDGVRRQTFRLEDPEKGVYIRPMVWRELKAFAPGTVCVVLASEVYDEGDYIRDYGEFKRETLTRGYGPVNSGVFKVGDFTG